LAITLLVASFAVYASVYLSPGSPEDVLFGSRPPTPEVREAVRHYLGLDEGFATRYFHWLGNVFSGDLGVSVITQQDVANRIADPLMITLALVAYASVLILVVGIGLGLLSALKPGIVDAVVTVLMSVATAIPSFVASALTISIFAVSLGWFPSFGLEPGFGGWIRSLTLPAISLAVIASGLLCRITRTTSRQQLAADHTQTAIARGISPARTIRSHVLRNSAGPIVAVGGLQIASLFAGSVIVEQAFGLGGLGQMLVSSVQLKDFPVVQAISLLIVSAFVVLNLLADLIGALVDPRVRASASL
jgi:peptide/nickel transport system permease protein